MISDDLSTNGVMQKVYNNYYCCPVKLFFKQNKLGLTHLTRYQPFWLSLFSQYNKYNHEQR